MASADSCWFLDYTFAVWQVKSDSFVNSKVPKNNELLSVWIEISIATTQIAIIHLAIGRSENQWKWKLSSRKFAASLHNI